MTAQTFDQDISFCDIALCERCQTPVEANIAVAHGSVVLTTDCPSHGKLSRVLEANSEFFGLQLQAQQTPGLEQLRWAGLGSIQIGIAQQPLAVTFEVTDDCDLTCSTCIANSFAGAGNFKPLPVLYKMMKLAVTKGGFPSTALISGGEPTMHPEIEMIIEHAFIEGFDHVVLVTNGKRISEDRKFVRRLKENFSQLEVFLQFDSVNPTVLTQIRGSDLRKLRLSALSQLTEAEIATTLVCVVASGASEDGIGEVIEQFSTVRNVKGINLQPLRVSGRHANTESVLSSDCSPSVGKLVEALERVVGFVKPNDIVPHPASPGMVACGYWSRSRGFVSRTAETVSSHSDGKVLSLFTVPKENDEDIFRLTIVNYQDRFSFRKSLTGQDPIFVVTPNFRLVPLDLYYMFGEPLGTCLGRSSWKLPFDSQFVISSSQSESQKCH